MKAAILLLPAALVTVLVIWVAAVLFLSIGAPLESVMP